MSPVNPNMPGCYAHTLGTKYDYIMTSDLSEFDTYDETICASIENDLLHLSEDNNHLTAEQYQMARARYIEVINYIQLRTLAHIKAELTAIKALLDNT